MEPSLCTCSKRKVALTLDKESTAWIEECTQCAKLWYCEKEKV
jgi:hypothetical protein